jgi:hypothetical protein
MGWQGSIRTGRVSAKMRMQRHLSHRFTLTTFHSSLKQISRNRCRSDHAHQELARALVDCNPPVWLVWPISNSTHWNGLGFLSVPVDIGHCG